MSTIGIVLGSSRSARIGDQVGQWVVDTARAAHAEHEWVFIDLRDHLLSPFDTAIPPMMANKQYDDPAVQSFSRLIDACDGFVFITPEYNHSVPAVLKNAIDHLGPEWAGKPAGFVGYGFTRAIRAITHLRDILMNFSMPQDRNQVGIDLSSALVDGTVTPQAEDVADLEKTLEFVCSTVAHQAAEL